MKMSQGPRLSFFGHNPKMEKVFKLMSVLLLVVAFGLVSCGKEEPQAQPAPVIDVVPDQEPDVIPDDPAREDDPAEDDDPVVPAEDDGPVDPTPVAEKAAFSDSEGKCTAEVKADLNDLADKMGVVIKAGMILEDAALTPADIDQGDEEFKNACHAFEAKYEADAECMNDETGENGKASEVHELCKQIEEDIEYRSEGKRPNGDCTIAMAMDSAGLQMKIAMMSMAPSPEMRAEMVESAKKGCRKYLEKYPASLQCQAEGRDGAPVTLKASDVKRSCDAL